MNNIFVILAITTIITNTVFVGYLLHKLGFKRGFAEGTYKMAKEFERLAIDLDIPELTVKVRPIKKSKNHPTMRKQSNSEIYDWKVDEKFDEIIDNNYQNRGDIQ